MEESGTIKGGTFAMKYNGEIPPHVETVCLLSNRKPDARVKIDVDLEDFYRIKDEQKKNKASE